MKIIFMKTLTLILMIFINTNCDGGSAASVSPNNISSTQAVADCNAFLSGVFCPKVVSCIPSITQTDCISQVQTSINCDTVIGENGELDTCETQLGNESCDVLAANPAMITSPASCTKVFLTH